MRAAASDLIGRSLLAQELDLTFDGKRSLTAALGYKKNLTPKDYRDRFERGGIAGTIVEAMPVACWRGGGELVEDDDPDVETPFEAAFTALDDRLHIWEAFRRLDILAGLGRYAVLLIGAPGELDTELPSLRGPQDIWFLSPFGEQDAKVDRLVEDATNRRFGEPERYSIRRIGVGASANQTKLVHWSRVLHFADGVLDDGVYGQPRLMRPWNKLDDLDKVTGGGAEAFWRRADQGLQVDLDPAVQMATGDEIKLSDEVDEYVHGMRRILRTRGVKVHALGADVANFYQPADAILLQISAITRIPHRILTGSERGELASTQDKTNWNERVSDRRTGECASQIVHPFIERLLQANALPTPVEYEVRWPEVKNLDDLDKANLAKRYAEVNQAQGETVISSDEIRDRVFSWEPLEETDELDEEPDAEGEGTGEAETDPADEAAAEDDDAEARAAAGLPASLMAIWRAASRHRARTRRVVETAFRDARGAVTLAAIESACRDRDREALTQLLQAAVETAGSTLAETLPPALTAALIAGGVAATATTRVVGAEGLRAADIGLSFDRTNPEAQRWAEERAATLVTQVTDNARQAIRGIVTQAFAEELPPRQAAKLVRSVIGLTDGQATAVTKLRARLATAAPGSLVKAGKVRIRVPTTGVTQTLMQRSVTSYAERLLRQRALTIAAHETLEASNAGQQQLWRQAVETGHLTGEEQREPIITPDERLCPICAALEGQRRGLTEPFTLPDGTTKMHAPFHVGCRCSQGIVVLRTSRAA